MFASIVAFARKSFIHAPRPVPSPDPRLRGAWKVLKGDHVMVMTGKDKGQTGVVHKVERKYDRVYVEGLNLAKKARAKSPTLEAGYNLIEAPIHASNVRVLDPVTGKPIRIGFKFTETGKRVRVTKGRNSSGSIVPIPARCFDRERERRPAGPRDTPREEVLRVTYVPPKKAPQDAKQSQWPAWGDAWRPVRGQ